MATSEESYLLELWDKNICPNCGKTIPPKSRTGSGKKTEGGFCSMDCYAEYHKTELLERFKRVSALAARHRDS